MVPTVTLPYYASDIPCPLPTTSEIDAAPDISLAYCGRRIVEIGEPSVVEFGKGVSLIEGEIMLFVQEKTPASGSLVSLRFIRTLLRGKTILLWKESPAESSWFQAIPTRIMVLEGDHLYNYRWLGISYRSETACVVSDCKIPAAKGKGGEPRRTLFPQGLGRSVLSPK